MTSVYCSLDFFSITDATGWSCRSKPLLMLFGWLLMPCRGLCLFGEKNNTNQNSFFSFVFHFYCWWIFLCLLVKERIGWKRSSITIVDAPQLKPCFRTWFITDILLHLWCHAHCRCGKRFAGVDLQPMESSLQQMGFVVQPKGIQCCCTYMYLCFQPWTWVISVWITNKSVLKNFAWSLIKGMNENRLSQPFFRPRI